MEQFWHRLLLLGLFLSTLCAATPQTAAQAGQDTDLTNDRIIQLTKLGLGDDIIIAKIKTGNCKFSLSDADLTDLKKAGVSDKVVAAMLEGASLSAPRVIFGSKPLDLHTLGEEKVGGRIGHALTYGIKSVKVKAYLEGPRAHVSGSGDEDIVIELPRADSPDNYLLVKLDGKKDRREMEVASVGGVVGQKAGVRAEAVVKTSSKDLGGNKFKIVPAGSLGPGEYIVYVVGSIDSIHGVYGKGYDFSVE